MEGNLDFSAAAGESCVATLPSHALCGVHEWEPQKERL